MRYALEHGFGGVVLYPYAYRSNHALVEEISRKIPLVTIDRRIISLETDFVGIHNHQATFDMTMHMIVQGHRRIAYVTKCEQVRPVQDRVQGYIDAVYEDGIPEIILPIPSNHREDPWLVADMAFGLPDGERPTAAVVYNDYAAVDLICHLLRLGLTVPGDIDPGHVGGLDGKRWLYTAGGHRIELSADGLSTVGERTKVYEGWQFPLEWKTEGFWLESPKLTKRGDFYYLICAEGGTAGPPTSHMAVVSRSKSPLVPGKTRHITLSSTRTVRTKPGGRLDTES